MSPKRRESYLLYCLFCNEAALKERRRKKDRKLTEESKIDRESIKEKEYVLE